MRFIGRKIRRGIYGITHIYMIEQSAKVTMSSHELDACKNYD